MMSRRDLLLGGAALLGASRSFAQAAPPKRFIAIYQPNGCYPSRWFPNGNETAFTLGESLTALQPYVAWISGIRRDQSPSRADTPKVQWSERYGVWKLHPLADWDEKRVWAYIHVNEIPYNPLHETGYRSIGCIPCTRPTSPEEEERAGRWAGSDKLECGIHGTSQIDEE